MFIEKKIVKKISQDKIFKTTFTNDNNFSISFFNYGNYINSIRIPYKNNFTLTEDIILGYKNFIQYLKDQSYLNCIVGRVCGRISNASFNLKGRKYKLNQNIKPNHLHGGKEGFNKKIWQIESLEQTVDRLKCVLKYTSRHLEEGYPGNLECKTTYSLTNKNEFIIDFVAECDQDTIVNLTNHNYWNFHGHFSYYQNIIDHVIQIHANYYCELDNNLIPTGRILNVKNTKFDFLKYSTLNNNILKNNGIDICYSINNYNGNLKEVATVYSDLTKMGMILYSNQPGLQFYTGNMMENYYYGKYKRKYGYKYGLCFEPQFFPDAINNRNFINPILCKGKRYNSSIIMKLKNDF